MIKRSPLAVFFLSFFLTIIYQIYWLVQTKRNMERLGAQIPTSWLIIVPFVSIYWDWEYSKGVEYVSEGSMSRNQAFFWMLLPTLTATILIILVLYLYINDLSSPKFLSYIVLFAKAISYSVLQGVFNEVNTKAILSRLSYEPIIPTQA